MTTAKPMDETEEIVAAAYERGFRDGITAYAWMKDGVYYVGTTGRTLKQAQGNIRDHHNYTP